MIKGDTINLQRKSAEVEECRECSRLMVNLDEQDLMPGDLRALKLAGVRISNPHTDKAVCISCEYQTFGQRVARYFEEDEDDDDSSFFSGGSFGALGGFSSGGFSSGGFGGFGGGGFSGGGAGRSF